MKNPREINGNIKYYMSNDFLVPKFITDCMEKKMFPQLNTGPSQLVVIDLFPEANLSHEFFYILIGDHGITTKTWGYPPHSSVKMLGLYNYEDVARIIKKGE